MIFSVPKLIRFHHCDPAGIVFYPQFFYLLHEVQEDFFAHIGFPEHVLIQSGYGIPIVDMKSKFMGMCRNGDKVDITLILSKVGGSSIGMRYEIWRAQTVVLRADAVVAYANLAKSRPVPIPDNLRQALLPYLDASKRESI